MIKRILFLVCAFALTTSLVHGQEGSNTLFKNVEKGNVGFLVELNGSASSISDAGLLLGGVRVGVVFDDKISFGALYRYNLNQAVPSEETLPGHYIAFQTTGGFFEYTLHSDKVVHLTFPIYFGAGEVETDHEDLSPGLGESNFFVVEPGVMAEVNLSKNLRLNAGILYGFTGNFTYRYLDQSDLQGLRFQMGLKAGLFKN